MHVYCDASCLIPLAAKGRLTEILKKDEEFFELQL